MLVIVHQYGGCGIVTCNINNMLICSYFLLPKRVCLYFIAHKINFSETGMRKALQISVCFC